MEQYRSASIELSATEPCLCAKTRHIGMWQLGKIIGEGATDCVILVRHTVTGQTAAAKVVLSWPLDVTQSKMVLGNDQDTLPSRDEREVIIIKYLRHLNIIALYDIRLEQDVSWVKLVYHCFLITDFSALGALY